MARKVFGKGTGGNNPASLGAADSYTGDALPVNDDLLVFQGDSPDIQGTTENALAAVDLDSVIAQSNTGVFGSAGDPVVLSVVDQIRWNGLVDGFVQCKGPRLRVIGTGSGKTLDVTSVGAGPGSDIDQIVVHGGRVNIDAAAEYVDLYVEDNAVVLLEDGAAGSGRIRMMGGQMVVNGAPPPIDVMAGELVLSGAFTAPEINLYGPQASLRPSQFEGIVTQIRHFMGQADHSSNGLVYTITNLEVHAQAVEDYERSGVIEFTNPPVLIGRESLAA